jgi:hypothetical protein
VRGLGVQWWIWSYPCLSTITVKEKTTQWYLLKHGKADFIQDHLHRYRDHSNGILQ